MSKPAEPRLVWITGAGKGIGRALALRYAGDGAMVVASARTETDLDALVAAAAPLAGEVYPLTLDITDRAACAAAVAEIEAAHGPIDLAILNAGTHRPSPARDFDAGAVAALIKVNLTGTVNCMGPLMARMIARRAGRIAVMASVVGYRGLPSAAAYGATKAALINLCEGLKPELDLCGVGLSVICPGFVRTPLTDRNDFPMPFLMAPEDAASRIAAGLRRGKFEIAFPRRLAWPMKLARLLPARLYFAVTRRMVPRDASAER